MKTEDLIVLFYSISNKFAAIEKKAISFSSGISLTTREIHTIDCIGRNNNINITQLARIQGVTKGAVSQMITKLSKKELVNKSSSPDTENEVVLSLSPLGKIYFDEHDNYHKDEYMLLSNYMKQLSSKDTNLIIEILREVDKLLESKL